MINPNYLNRTSVRHYLDKPLDPKTIEDLKTIINLSPTSMNCQGFSAIFVTDPSIKEQLKACNFDNKHVANAPLVIVFCADYNRIQYAFDTHQNNTKVGTLDQFLVAFADAIIASGNVHYATTEMGLGTCYLGGLRQKADQVAKILNIQGKCMPVLGMTIGYPAKTVALRPKVNKCYDNHYDLYQIHQEIKKYDGIMTDYYHTVFNLDTNFTKIVAEQLGKVMDPTMEDKIKKLFFNNN